MKRILLIAIMTMVTLSAAISQDVMVVTKGNGTKAVFNVNDIKDITFVDSKDNSVALNSIELTSSLSFKVSFTVNSVNAIEQAGVRYGHSADNIGIYTAEGSVDENGMGEAVVNSGLDYNTTYYVWAYIKVDGEYYYSDKAQVVTSAKYPVGKAVDMGLSVKWASCDLGALTENNTGLYLPWGDPTGNAYNSATYPWGEQNNLSSISGTKYDIARTAWGDKWRLPSQEEFQELIDNTTQEIIKDFGENKCSVLKMTSKINGNVIYLYRSGYKENGVLRSYDSYGYYWTGDNKISANGNNLPACRGVQSAANFNESSTDPHLCLTIRPVYGDVTNGEPGGEEREYVDLGLSRLWAKTNYGAIIASETGKRVAWGENVAKETYTKENYSMYVDGDYRDISKNDQGNYELINDGLDPVANEWGGKWHMPNYAEMTELIEQCTWTETTLNGVKGYNVTGPNGKSIFLPTGDDGEYWTGEGLPDSTDKEYAYRLKLSSHSIGYHYKYKGKYIRPVRKR